jgi:DNA-binding NarL/FixJ family response regulator
MLSEKIKAIADTKAKLLLLEQELSTERDVALVGLIEKFGFSTADELISAIRTASSRTKKSKDRSYSRITPRIRDEVNRLFNAGKSAIEIAAETGISLASVSNVKKSLGLVKARRK